MFTRFPQISRVFFGGAHDNGYTSTLNYLQNEGLHQKLTILRGYRELAPEVRALNLPQVDIQGVFLTEKIPSNKKSASQAQNGNNGNVSVQAQDFDKFRHKSTPVQNKSTSGSPARKDKTRKLVPNTVRVYPSLTVFYITRSQPLHKRTCCVSLLHLTSLIRPFR